MELDPSTLRVGQRVRVVGAFGGETTGTIIQIEETMNGIREVTLDTGEVTLAPAPGDPNPPLAHFFPGRAATPPPRRPVQPKDTPGRKIPFGATRRRSRRKQTRRRRVVRRLIRT